uniref:Sulfhydryl oxidase n=1 Tax=Mesocestoides corti TaxID=53468 RepID=A0A5K3F1K6_MESCO
MVQSLLPVFLCIVISNAGVYAASLYKSDGQIMVLTSKNFSDFVQAQPTLVQFYLHSCGACQNYVPIFKRIIKSVAGWQWAFRTAVVDCADPLNEKLIEEHNISSFPTFLFFLKGTAPVRVNKMFDEDAFRKKIAGILVEEQQHNRLIPGQEIPDAVTISGPDARIIAMIILDFQMNSSVILRSQISEDSQFRLVDRTGKVAFTSSDEDAFRHFLTKNYVTVHKEQPLQDSPGLSNPAENQTSPVAYSMPVYAADIIASLQYLLVRDVGIKATIKGSDLDALKEFMAVVSKYLNLGRRYNEDVAYLRKHIEGMSEITRKEWHELVAGLNISTDQVQHIACRGSKPYLRGYPCGLWIMFHSMSVNRFLQSKKPEPKAPIAHALNRFVPRFFSCSYCAYHFARLTSNVRLSHEDVYPDSLNEEPPFPLVVPDPSSLPAAPKSSRDEVLWLNTVHNLVNKRLSGNPSEDPAAPKVVFPSPEQCRACWSPAAQAKLKRDKFSATPDKTDELLAYLVHHYRPSSWRWDGISVSFEDVSHFSRFASH